MKLSSNVVRLSTSVRIASPQAAQTLEQAWQRRRQELAGWQPSGGWLLEPRIVARRSKLTRVEATHTGGTSKD